MSWTTSLSSILMTGWLENRQGVFKRVRAFHFSSPILFHSQALFAWSSNPNVWATSSLDAEDRSILVVGYRRPEKGLHNHFICGASHQLWDYIWQDRIRLEEYKEIKKYLREIFFLGWDGSFRASHKMVFGNKLTTGCQTLYKMIRSESRWHSWTNACRRRFQPKSLHKSLGSWRSKQHYPLRFLLQNFHHLFEVTNDNGLYFETCVWPYIAPFVKKHLACENSSYLLMTHSSRPWVLDVLKNTTGFSITV